MHPMNELMNKGRLVGSRYTCSPAPTDTDLDILVLDKPGVIFTLMIDGFVLEGVGPDYETMPDFSSYRKGDLNVIVAHTDLFFQGFIKATEICKQINILEKSERINLFQYVLYDVAPPSKAKTLDQLFPPITKKNKPNTTIRQGLICAIMSIIAFGGMLLFLYGLAYGFALLGEPQMQWLICDMWRLC